MGNRQEFNQGKKVIIIPITVTNSFSNFDFIVESFKLAGTYLMFCMIDKSRQSFFKFPQNELKPAHLFFHCIASSQTDVRIKNFL